MKRPAPFLAVIALLHLAVPAPAAAAVVMVPLCGGGAVPLPMKRNENSPCCGKLCHVNDRKRSSGQCCGQEDEPDDA